MVGSAWNSATMLFIGTIVLITKDTVDLNGDSRPALSPIHTFDTLAIYSPYKNHFPVGRNPFIISKRIILINYSL